jgi:hypothetical protein
MRVAVCLSPSAYIACICGADRIRVAHSLGRVLAVVVLARLEAAVGGVRAQRPRPGVVARNAARLGYEVARANRGPANIQSLLAARVRLHSE